MFNYLTIYCANCDGVTPAQGLLVLIYLFAHYFKNLLEYDAKMVKIMATKLPEFATVLHSF